MKNKTNIYTKTVKKIELINGLINKLESKTGLNLNDIEFENEDVFNISLNIFNEVFKINKINNNINLYFSLKSKFYDIEINDMDVYYLFYKNEKIKDVYKNNLNFLSQKEFYEFYKNSELFNLFNNLKEHYLKNDEFGYLQSLMCNINC